MRSIQAETTYPILPHKYSPMPYHHGKRGLTCMSDLCALLARVAIHIHEQGPILRITLPRPTASPHQQKQAN